MGTCETCGRVDNLVFSLSAGRTHVCVSCSQEEQLANTKRGVWKAYLVGSMIVGAFVLYVIFRIFAAVGSGPR